MILAVDCGSTNLKAALYDAALNRVAVHSLPIIYTRRDAVHAEFDADRLWADFQAIVRSLLLQAGCSLDALTRISLGSQAQSFCLLDSEDRPLMPFISWMDVRADQEAALLAARFGKEFHHHCSFAPPSPALEIGKLIWVKTHLPDVWARARRLVSVPGFLCQRLAGVNPLDTNLAAMNGLYSLSSGGWWTDILDFADVSADWLPGLAPAGHPWKGRWQLPEAPGRPIEIILAGNDHTAGAVGNGCRPGEIIITFGTALVAYRRTGDKPGPYHPGGCWGPYPLGGFYELAASSHGCSSLDWARNIVLPDQPASAFDALAATAGVGSGGVRFYPERARTENAWVGSGTDAERARAVLEGILFTLRHLLEDEMQAWPVTRVCALGGGGKSRFWMQMASDLLGCTVRAGQGDSLLGAAALAAGQASELESRVGDPLDPDPDRHARYAGIYDDWCLHRIKVE